jgi:hypothetical protein
LIQPFPLAQLNSHWSLRRGKLNWSIRPPGWQRSLGGLSGKWWCPRFGSFRVAEAIGGVAKLPVQN